MSYDELKNYIKSQKEIGINENDIRDALNEKSWDPELINKAFEESVDSKELTDSNTISKLVSYTWNSFIENFWIYVKASLVSILMPMFSAFILLIPLLYDVVVLKFTATDFLTKSFLPIFIAYIIVIAIVIFFIAAYGNLIMTLVVKNNGKIKLIKAMSESWGKISGYFWVNILSFFFASLTLIPPLVMLILVATKFVTGKIIYFLIPASLAFFIPTIIISVLLSFSVFTYVFDEYKGFSAIKESYRLIKNNFLFVISRLAFLWLVIMVVSQISVSLPYTNFVLGILTAPISIIYISKVYTETKLQSKQKSA